MCEACIPITLNTPRRNGTSQERELALLKRVPIHTSISKAASINEAAALAEVPLPFVEDWITGSLRAAACSTIERFRVGEITPRFKGFSVCLGAVRCSRAGPACLQPLLFLFSLVLDLIRKR